MKILILGGTRFVGRHFVESLLASDGNKHDITIYQRGKTNADFFPNIPRIYGDREESSYEELAGNYYDMVIDFCGYHPTSLKRLIDRMQDRIGHYIFISTVSVYDTTIQRTYDEDAPVLDYNSMLDKQGDASYYGERKSECERLLMDVIPLKLTILRPGLIYGQYDHTDRLYYWIYRCVNNSEFIVPAEASMYKMNFTYVNDLAHIILGAMENRLPKVIYNATTQEASSLSYKLYSIMSNVSTHPKLYKMSQLMLDHQGLNPWTKFPVYYPQNLVYPCHSIESDSGLKFSSFSASLESLIPYYKELGYPIPNYGLSLAEEVKIIQRFTQV